MTRRLVKLIRKLEFSEDQRRYTTLVGDVRLDPEKDCLSLSKFGGSGYSTDLDAYVKTKRFNPSTAKKWIGFQCQSITPTNSEGVQSTSVHFRLSRDGTEQIWWNGAAWVGALAGEWNTEAEVATFIDRLPTNVRGMQALINLRTADESVTPFVYWVKFLYESDIEPEEDYLARSLVPALRQAIRPIAEYYYKMDIDSAEIPLLGDPGVETPYKIVSIDSVYDLTNDPDSIEELDFTFDEDNKRIELPAPSLADTTFRVRFVYEPVVIVSNVSQDYTELARVPAILIENVNIYSVAQAGAADWVLNKSTGKGWKVELDVNDIEFDVSWIVDKTIDAHRLSSRIRNFFAESKLVSAGLDEDFDMRIVNDFTSNAASGQNELQGGRLRVRIYRALFSRRDAVEVNATLRFVVSGGNIVFQVP